MLKNFINRVKNLVEQNKDSKISIDENVNETSLENNNVDVEEIKEKLVENTEDLVTNDMKESEEEIEKDSTCEDVSIESEINKTQNQNIEEYIKDEIDLVDNETNLIHNESIENNSLDNPEYQEDIIEETSEKAIIEDIIIEGNKQQVNEEELISKEIDEEVKETKECEVEEEELKLTQEDIDYIKEIKIKRGLSIKAIDVYTKEPQIFKTHKECSKKLKVPLDYIKENLKYGYTDYLGEAIKYLSEELSLEDKEYKNYLDSNKTPSQLLSTLNNKIFTAKISEDKRDDILCNEKIDPIKMHYTFECIDSEYDDYFEKYKSIIKRGGKKKIELVDKKGEVIEIFKSIDECANFLQKEREEIVNMLKYNETKVGRYEIRYSLRNI